MSGTTKEALKTPEIKTPEELIKRLEAKTQNALADKVRTIEQTVTDGTESKWKKLQAELPESEKKEIETILKDENPEVGTRLKTVAEVTVATAGIATVIDQLDGSMEKSGLGKLGIKDSIREWLTEALTEKPDPEDGFFGGIMHKLQLLFLVPLAKMFGVKIPEKGEKDPKNNEKPDEKNNKELNKKEAISSIGFTAGYKGFARIYKNSIPDIKGEIEVSKLDSIFNYGAFQKLTFQQADDLYKKYKSTPDKKELLKDVKLENAVDVNTLYLCLGLMVASDGRKFLEKKYPEGLSTKTIGEIFEGIKDQFNIAANLESIEINSLQDVTGFMGEIGKKMDLMVDSEGNIKTPELKEKTEKLGLNKKDLLMYVLIQNPHLPITELSTNESIELLQLDSESKNKLREIISFGKKIQQSIAESFSFGNKDVYSTYLNTHPVGLSDSFKMYAILGGKTDQSMMSSAEQLYVYQKTWHILGKDPVLRGKYFDGPISEALWNSKNNIHIPEEVKKVFQSLMSKAFEKFKDKSTGIAKELWAYLDTTTIVAITAALAAYFFWGKRISWLLTGATLATLTYTIAALLKNSAGSDGMISLSSGKISPEKGAEIFVQDAKDKIG